MDKDMQKISVTEKGARYRVRWRRIHPLWWPPKWLLSAQRHWDMDTHVKTSKIRTDQDGHYKDVGHLELRLCVERNLNCSLLLFHEKRYTMNDYSAGCLWVFSLQLWPRWRSDHISRVFPFHSWWICDSELEFRSQESRVLTTTPIIITQNNHNLLWLALCLLIRKLLLFRISTSSSTPCWSFQQDERDVTKSSL